MAQAENIDARRVIKRAWEDGNFRGLLLRDPRGALEELNIDVPGHLSLAVYDNTGSTHHMVICTPCSCYPSFLGTAPHFWKDPNYKTAIISDPAAWLEPDGHCTWTRRNAASGGYRREQARLCHSQKARGRNYRGSLGRGGNHHEPRRPHALTPIAERMWHGARRPGRVTLENV